jgi:hypothetical protein
VQHKMVVVAHQAVSQHLRIKAIHPLQCRAVRT